MGISIKGKPAPQMIKNTAKAFTVAMSLSEAQVLSQTETTESKSNKLDLSGSTKRKLVRSASLPSDSKPDTCRN